MPINITEEFVCNLIEQNAALIAQVANLSETVESLNQTIKDLQEQLNKIYLGTLISFSTKWVLNSYVDFKYMEEELARKFSFAPDYPEIAKKALARMLSLTGEPVFDEKGMLQKGVIVRHLLLPGHKRNAREVIEYIHQNYGDRVILSLMNQYTPLRD